MIFTSKDKELIFSLVRELIGSKKVAEDKAKIFLTNITRRINFHGCKSLQDYLRIAEKNKEEFKELVSALTIHTTHWFRESVHYKRIEEYVKIIQREKKQRTIQAMSFGCSTGEEVYSLAFVFEQMNKFGFQFEYKIIGRDIDPVSIETARAGIYNSQFLKQIPKNYLRCVLHGTGRSEGFFAVKKPIRNRCDFKSESILEFNPSSYQKMDIILCRNILIYFQRDQIEQIINKFHLLLKPGGIVVLGHSEGLIEDGSKFKKHGNTIYEKLSEKYPKGSPKYSSPQKHYSKSILVVDDSKVICAQLSEIFEEGGYDVYLAEDASQATKKLQERSFDLITLDLNMPGKNGSTWLSEQRKLGNLTPIVIITSVSKQEATVVLDALEKGANEFIEKIWIKEKPEIILNRVKNLMEPKLQIQPEIVSPKPVNVSKKISKKILVVDDDSDIGDWLAQNLKCNGFNAQSVNNPDKAVNIAQTSKVDLLITDFMMPSLNGLELFEKVRLSNAEMKCFLMTGFIDKEIKNQALGQGVFKVLDKPFEADQLILEIERALNSTIKLSSAEKPDSPDAIVIGASTGGTEALMRLLADIGSYGRVPPFFVVQHIPSEFSEAFAERLSKRASLTLGVMEDGSALKDNTLYIAVGDYHIGIKRTGTVLRLKISDDPPQFSQRPAVEYLFKTAASIKSVSIIGALLTGMGSDGATGLRDLKEAGALTMAQSEASCVVYGMPKEAIKIGAAQFVGDLAQIRSRLDEAIKSYRKMKVS